MSPMTFLFFLAQRFLSSYLLTYLCILHFVYRGFPALIIFDVIQLNSPPIFKLHKLHFTLNLSTQPRSNYVASIIIQSMTHLRSQYVKLRWQHDWSHSKPTLLFSQCEQLHISSQCSSVFQRPQNSFSRDNEVEIIPLIQFCVNRRGNRNLFLFIFLATFFKIREYFNPLPNFIMDAKLNRECLFLQLAETKIIG
ncbi:Hypothetical_protein [Hexamita inflata]|uniref:Hypothetical_protein n=1 Tax=Hexamita inflata TaxID=28002 RepID=A0AA86PKA1_9EUKA|nr:Hypothetical protein HINF_LOCUS27462 [Hexamita inflata]